MTTALAAQQAAAVELGPGVEATPVGLVFEERDDFEDWAWVGSRLGNLANASAWWIADWIRVGYGRYGQLANEAAAKFGLSPDVLSNYRAVAERIELPRRRGNLSFSHHADIAYLEPGQQDAWLDKAAAEEWSQKDLREALRASRELPPDTDGTVVTLEQIRLTVPPDRAERWRSAADRAGVGFSEWAAVALDQAAA